MIKINKRVQHLTAEEKDLLKNLFYCEDDKKVSNNFNLKGNKLMLFHGIADYVRSGFVFGNNQYEIGKSIINKLFNKDIRKFYIEDITIPYINIPIAYQGGADIVAASIL